MLDKIEGADVSAASTVDETTADHDAPAPTVIVSDHYRLVNENRLRVRSDGCVSYILGRKKFRRLFFRVGGRVRAAVGGGGLVHPFILNKETVRRSCIPSSARGPPVRLSRLVSSSRKFLAMPALLPWAALPHPRPGGVSVRRGRGPVLWRDV